MKINKIKINSYGKLNNKEIDLKNGINIIYGKNESGKSTLINFIKNSFYGISKNKNGKEISDYEKYKPWVGEEFSGKIEYELSNKNRFEIYRDFNKKNPKIFNENMEEISKNFNIDKNKGNEFFYEQTKIDEELFLSTLAINQNEVKLENQEQNVLIQKIANAAQTGDDNISFKRVIDRINKRQLDEVGTERTREKPINQIEKNIKKLEEEKNNLEKYKDLKYEFEEKVNIINEKLTELEVEEKFLNEMKNLQEKFKLEEEKIKTKEKIRDEILESIKKQKNEIENLKIQNKNVLKKYDEKKSEKNSIDENEKNKKVEKNEINNFKNKTIKNNSKKIKNNQDETLKNNFKKNKKIKIFNISFLILLLINIIQFICIKKRFFKILCIAYYSCI